LAGDNGEKIKRFAYYFVSSDTIFIEVLPEFYIPGALLFYVERSSNPLPPFYI
jgi:hypothetical protein